MRAKHHPTHRQETSYAAAAYLHADTLLEGGSSKDTIETHPGTRVSHHELTTELATAAILDLLDEGATLTETSSGPMLHTPTQDGNGTLAQKFAAGSRTPIHLEKLLARTHPQNPREEVCRDVQEELHELGALQERTTRRWALLERRNLEQNQLRWNQLREKSQHIPEKLLSDPRAPHIREMLHQALQPRRHSPLYLDVD